MDIKIDNEEGKFKFRVCGVLEYKGKYLAVKMNNTLDKSNDSYKL